MARFYAHPYSSKLIRALLITFVLVFVVGLNAFAQVPTITSFSPSSGPVGTEVTINGSGFEETVVVHIGSSSSLFEIVDENQIKVIIPYNTG